MISFVVSLSNHVRLRNRRPFDGAQGEREVINFSPKPLAVSYLRPFVVSLSNHRVGPSTGSVRTGDTYLAKRIKRPWRQGTKLVLSRTS